MRTQSPLADTPSLQLLPNADVLNVLNIEIDDVTGDLAQPGWTRWAVIAALAATGWTAIDTFQATPTEATTRALPIAVAGLYLVKFLRGLYNLLQQEDLDTPIRFVTTESQFRPQSARNFLDAGVGIASIYVVILYSNLLAPWESITCVSIIGLWTIVAALALFYSRKPGYFLDPPSTTGLVAWLLSALVILCLLVAVILFARTMAIQDLQTLRLAALILAAQVLGDVYASIRQVNPLLVRLRRIRRDLSFGRLTASDALRQADIALNGLDLNAYTQIWVAKLLRPLGAAASSLARANAVLHSLVDVVSKTDETARNSLLAVLNATKQGVERELQTYQESASDLERQHEALKKHLSALATLDKRIAAAGANAIAPIETAIASLRAQSDLVSVKAAALNSPSYLDEIWRARQTGAQPQESAPPAGS